MSAARLLALALACALLAAPSCRPREPVQLARPGVAPGQPNVPAPGAPPPGGQGKVCGRLSNQPIVPKTDRYLPSEPECNRAATIWGNVAHEELVCQTDADCVPLGGGAGGCFSAALNRNGAANPEYQARPCGNPLAGACMARPIRAYCAEGCCQVM